MMTDQVLLCAQLLFWFLVLFSCTLSLPWSIVSYLALSNIDMSAVYLNVGPSVGIDNAVKILIVPAVLFFRLGKQFPTSNTWRLVGKLWICLILYSAVASLWSPYRLAAWKMVGYLVSYLALFLVFFGAWTKRVLNPRLVLISVWATLLLGFIQTYIFGNAFGTLDENYFAPRFTSFTSPQSFALFLVCMFSILLASHRKSSFFWLSALPISFGIISSGSRYCLLGLMAVMAIYIIFPLDKRKSGGNTLRTLKSIVISSLVAALILLSVNAIAPNNRVNELVEDYASGPANLEDIATISWRLGIYRESFSRLESVSRFRLLTGQGTSSGGSVRAALGVEYSAPEDDPNRVFHDEFLRCFYEWGFVGLVCIVGVLWLTTKRSWTLFQKFKSKPARAFLMLLPTIILGLMIENILSNAGSPGGTGIVAVLALVASSDVQTYAAVTRNQGQDESTAWSIDKNNGI